jgi:hypothetical protein
MGAERGLETRRPELRPSFKARQQENDDSRTASQKEIRIDAGHHC